MPDWNNQKARVIFDQMLVHQSNKIDAVAAANDGLAGAVVASLQAHHLKPIPLSGQDATPGGVQYILAGWQTMTVYKSVKAEAKAAANAAIAIINHKKVKTNSSISNGDRNVPSIFLKPVSITQSPSGKTIVDFGQNISGWVRLSVQGERSPSFVSLTNFPSSVKVWSRLRPRSATMRYGVLPRRSMQTPCGVENRPPSRSEPSQDRMYSPFEFH